MIHVTVRWRFNETEKESNISKVKDAAEGEGICAKSCVAQGTRHYVKETPEVSLALPEDG